MRSGAPNALLEDGNRAASVRTARSELRKQGGSPWQPAGVNRSKSTSAANSRRTYAEVAGEAKHSQSGRSSDKENNASFQVAVRVRPLSAREQRDEAGLCCLFDGGGRRVSVPPPQSRSYAFDCVFPPESSQEEVYACTSPLLRAALDGFNAALLAYGQTGAGKTYTLGFEGSLLPGAPLRGCPPRESDARDRKGILPRACEDVFRLIQDRKHRHAARGEKLDAQVTCSFLELYNEEIRDLLGDSQPLRSLAIRRDAVSGQVTVQDLRSVPCSSPQDLLACLHQGSQRRTTGSTAQNNASSRSHAIFSIFLKQQIWCSSSSTGCRCAEEAVNSSGNQAASAASSRVVVSLVQFADLAGSERGKKSGTGGQRLAEGIAINSGLLALAKVIRALTQQQKRKMHEHQQQQQRQEQQHQLRRQRHVPYRDSKLTRLLEPVLGGNSKAVMIACVSPAAKDLHETVQTLDYAARARLIQNDPTINTKPTGDLIASLREEILKLKLLLSARETSEPTASPDAGRRGEDLSSRHQEQPQQQSSDTFRPPSEASAEEEESEDNRLRQELSRLAEEAAGLRRQVEILEGQLLQQVEGQHQQQENGMASDLDPVVYRAEPVSHHCAHPPLLALLYCFTEVLNVCVACLCCLQSDVMTSQGPSSVAISRQPPSAASSDEGEERHRLLQLHQERLLLVREQQLLQRDQQLRQEVMLDEQQQLQRQSKAHLNHQAYSTSCRPQQNIQSPALVGLEQHERMRQLQEGCQLMQQRQTASDCSEGAVVDKSVGDSVHLNGNKEGRRKRSTAHLLSSDLEPLSNLKPPLIREEGWMASPAKKREKRGRRPAVFFSVVDRAHESPIKKASFLPADNSAAQGNACLQPSLLLTASDFSLKMWDLQRMTARWRYITKSRHSPFSTEPLMSFWGLTPALKGSLVVAGLGNCIQTFDFRAGKPQRREAWAVKGSLPCCLAVGEEGLGETEMFVSFVDGFVRLYDLRKLECSSCIEELKCGPVSDMCCLLFDAFKRASSSHPPHSHLVVSSPLESLRVFTRGSWISLGGPCCSSVATLPGSCIADPWEPRAQRRPSQGGSLLAALDEKGETLRTWNLPTSVCAAAGPQGDASSSCPRPLAASLEVTATTTSTATAAAAENEGAAARLTSLAAWNSKGCFATANEAGKIRFWECGAACPPPHSESSHASLALSPSFFLSPGANLPWRLRAGDTSVTTLAAGGSELLLAASADCSFRLFRTGSD
ncbi:hypothetical protein Esti_001412 [Eimeria stiedai]